VSAATARLLHRALLGSAVLALAALAVARQISGFTPPHLPLTALRVVAFAAAVASLACNRALRLGLEAPGRDADRAEWWERYGGRLFVVWAVAEGAVTLGAALWFLTGDAVMLVVASGVGLLVLLTARPEAYGGA